MCGKGYLGSLDLASSRVTSRRILPQNLFGGFIVAEGYEFGVAEEGTGGPFGEFDLGDDFGAEPYIVCQWFGEVVAAPGTTS